jgi:ubiquinone/menaquinone biosynthesis C-methylase UbiE
MSDPQDSITRFWSTIADGYEAHPGNVVEPGSDAHDRWVAVVRSLLPPEASDVLDLACGTGFLSLIVDGLGHRVTGIDLSAQMLDVARSRPSGVRFAEGDAVEPPFPPGSFDAVTSRHLLWTLREPERALHNWRALLRPGGRVVAFDGFFFREGEELPPVFADHYTPETRAALPLFGLTELAPVIDVFRRAGFEDVQASELPELADGDAVPYVVTGVPSV